MNIGLLNQFINFVTHCLNNWLTLLVLSYLNNSTCATAWRSAAFHQLKEQSPSCTFGRFSLRFSVTKAVCSQEVFMTFLTIVTWIFFPSQTRCPFQFSNMPSLSAFLGSKLNFLPGIKRLRVRNTRKSGKNITLFFALYSLYKNTEVR